jgi:hypothetical protein
MRIEKIATQYETRFIAEDGKRWETEQLCEQYEELLKDPSPLKALRFFDGNGDPIDVFSLEEIPCFCYLVLTDRINYHWSVVKAIIGNIGRSDESSYKLPTSEGVWFNDWSNAYNGGYGYNGWVRVDSIESLENQIKGCQKKIKLLKKITNTP